MRLRGSARAARRAPPALLAVALCAAACVGPGPVVDHRVHEVRDGALARVAVVPFAAASQLSSQESPAAMEPRAAADVVARIVSEAFAAAGVDTVPPSDLALAFQGGGGSLPRADVAANARLAAREFGATAVVLGKLGRYREREGGAAGALRPASVLFEVAVYTAPGGALLYTGRFDQTQQALSANPLLARRYPGRGTRWLTAAELARWGADEVVATLPEAMR